jgi:phosphoglucomutase
LVASHTEMETQAHPLAGKPVPAEMLANIPRLVTAYYAERPDPLVASQRVAFGTSGHRGQALKCSFNEAHVLAITQAIVLYRKAQGIKGPLFLGMDTHALSEPAFATALEVLAANDVDVMIDRDAGYTPTPVISHAIQAHNRFSGAALADGIVITPSHNPPEHGGFKYNPPHGGPAESQVTAAVEASFMPGSRARSGFPITSVPTHRRRPHKRPLWASSRPETLQPPSSPASESKQFSPRRPATAMQSAD